MSDVHRTLTFQIVLSIGRETQRTTAKNESFVCRNLQDKRCDAVLLLTAACFVTEEDVITVYKEAFRSMERL